MSNHHSSAVAPQIPPAILQQQQQALVVHIEFELDIFLAAIDSENPYSDEVILLTLSEAENNIDGAVSFAKKAEIISQTQTLQLKKHLSFFSFRQLNDPLTLNATRWVEQVSADLKEAFATQEAV